MFINPGAAICRSFKSDAATVQTNSEPTRVIRADTAHLLMADVSLQSLHVRESTYRDLPLWGQALVRNGEGRVNLGW